MDHTIIAAGYFVLSAANDDLNVRWLQALRSGKPLLAATLSSLLGIVGWVPFLLLVTTSNWQIVVADVLGSFVGSYLAVKRQTTEARSESR